MKNKNSKNSAKGECFNHLYQKVSCTKKITSPCEFLHGDSKNEDELKVLYSYKTNCKNYTSHWADTQCDTLEQSYDIFSSWPKDDLSYPYSYRPWDVYSLSTRLNKKNHKVNKRHHRKSLAPTFPISHAISTNRVRDVQSNEITEMRLNVVNFSNKSSTNDNCQFKYNYIEPMIYKTNFDQVKVIGNVKKSYFEHDVKTKESRDVCAMEKKINRISRVQDSMCRDQNYKIKRVKDQKLTDKSYRSSTSKPYYLERTSIESSSSTFLSLLQKVRFTDHTVRKRKADVCNFQSTGFLHQQEKNSKIGYRLRIPKLLLLGLVLTAWSPCIIAIVLYRYITRVFRPVIKQRIKRQKSKLPVSKRMLLTVRKYVPSLFTRQLFRNESNRKPYIFGYKNINALPVNNKQVLSKQNLAQNKSSNEVEKVLGKKRLLYGYYKKNVSRDRSYTKTEIKDNQKQEPLELCKAKFKRYICPTKYSKSAGKKKLSDQLPSQLTHLKPEKAQITGQKKIHEPRVDAAQHKKLSPKHGKDYEDYEKRLKIYDDRDALVQSKSATEPKSQLLRKRKSESESNTIEAKNMQRKSIMTKYDKKATGHRVRYQKDVQGQKSHRRVDEQDDFSLAHRLQERDHEGRTKYLADRDTPKELVHHNFPQIRKEKIRRRPTPYAGREWHRSVREPRSLEPSVVPNLDGQKHAKRPKPYTDRESNTKKEPTLKSEIEPNYVSDEVISDARQGRHRVYEDDKATSLDESHTIKEPRKRSSRDVIELEKSTGFPKSHRRLHKKHKELSKDGKSEFLSRQIGFSPSQENVKRKYDRSKSADRRHEIKEHKNVPEKIAVELKQRNPRVNEEDKKKVEEQARKLKQNKKRPTKDVIGLKEGPASPQDQQRRHREREKKLTSDIEFKNSLERDVFDTEQEKRGVNENDWVKTAKRRHKTKKHIEEDPAPRQVDHRYHRDHKDRPKSDTKSESISEERTSAHRQEKGTVNKDWDYTPETRHKIKKHKKEHSRDMIRLKEGPATPRSHHRHPREREKGLKSDMAFKNVLERDVSVTEHGKRKVIENDRSKAARSKHITKVHSKEDLAPRRVYRRHPVEHKDKPRSDIESKSLLEEDTSESRLEKRKEDEDDWTKIADRSHKIGEDSKGRGREIIRIKEGPTSPRGYQRRHIDRKREPIAGIASKNVTERDVSDTEQVKREVIEDDTSETAKKRHKIKEYSKKDAALRRVHRRHYIDNTEKRRSVIRSKYLPKDSTSEARQHKSKGDEDQKTETADKRQKQQQQKTGEHRKRRNGNMIGLKESLIFPRSHHRRHRERKREPSTDIAPENVLERDVFDTKKGKRREIEDDSSKAVKRRHKTKEYDKGDLAPRRVHRRHHRGHKDNPRSDTEFKSVSEEGISEARQEEGTADEGDWTKRIHETGEHGKRRSRYNIRLKKGLVSPRGHLRRYREQGREPTSDAAYENVLEKDVSNTEQGIGRVIEDDALKVGKRRYRTKEHSEKDSAPRQDYRRYHREYKDKLRSDIESKSVSKEGIAKGRLEFGKPDKDNWAKTANRKHKTVEHRKLTPNIKSKNVLEREVSDTEQEKRKVIEDVMSKAAKKGHKTKEHSHKDPASIRVYRRYHRKHKDKPRSDVASKFVSEEGTSESRQEIDKADKDNWIEIADRKHKIVHRKSRSRDIIGLKEGTVSQRGHHRLYREGERELISDIESKNELKRGVSDIGQGKLIVNKDDRSEKAKRRHKIKEHSKKDTASRRVHSRYYKKNRDKQRSHLGSKYLPEKGTSEARLAKGKRDEDDWTKAADKSYKTGEHRKRRSRDIIRLKKGPVSPRDHRERERELISDIKSRNVLKRVVSDTEQGNQRVIEDDRSKTAKRRYIAKEHSKEDPTKRRVYRRHHREHKDKLRLVDIESKFGSEEAISEARQDQAKRDEDDWSKKADRSHETRKYKKNRSKDMIRLKKGPAFSLGYQRRYRERERELTSDVKPKNVLKRDISHTDQVTEDDESKEAKRKYKSKVHSKEAPVSRRVHRRQHREHKGKPRAAVDSRSVSEEDATEARQRRGRVNKDDRNQTADRRHKTKEYSKRGSRDIIGLEERRHSGHRTVHKREQMRSDNAYKYEPIEGTSNLKRGKQKAIDDVKIEAEHRKKKEKRKRGKDLALEKSSNSPLFHDKPHKERVRELRVDKSRSLLGLGILDPKRKRHRVKEDVGIKVKSLEYKLKNQKKRRSKISFAENTTAPDTRYKRHKRRVSPGIKFKTELKDITFQPSQAKRIIQKDDRTLTTNTRHRKKRNKDITDIEGATASLQVRRHRQYQHHAAGPTSDIDIERVLSTHPKHKRRKEHVRIFPRLGREDTVYTRRQRKGSRRRKSSNKRTTGLEAFSRGHRHRRRHKSNESILNSNVRKPSRTYRTRKKQYRKSFDRNRTNTSDTRSQKRRKRKKRRDMGITGSKKDKTNRVRTSDLSYKTKDIQRKLKRVKGTTSRYDKEYDAQPKSNRKDKAKRTQIHSSDYRFKTGNTSGNSTDKAKKKKQRGKLYRNETDTKSDLKSKIIPSKDKKADAGNKENVKMKEKESKSKPKLDTKPNILTEKTKTNSCRCGGCSRNPELSKVTKQSTRRVQNECQCPKCHGIKLGKKHWDKTSNNKNQKDQTKTKKDKLSVTCYHCLCKSKKSLNGQKSAKDLCSRFKAHALCGKCGNPCLRLLMCLFFCPLTLCGALCVHLICKTR